MERGKSSYSRDPVALPPESLEAIDVDPVNVTGHVVDTVSGAELGAVSFSADAEAVATKYRARFVARTAVVGQMGGNLGAVGVADELVDQMVEDARYSLQRAEQIAMPSAEFYADPQANDMAEGIAELEETPLFADADTEEESEAGVEFSEDDDNLGSETSLVLVSDESDPAEREYLATASINETPGEDTEDDETETVNNLLYSYAEFLGTVGMLDATEVADEYDAAETEEGLEDIDRFQSLVHSLVLGEVSTAELEESATLTSEQVLGSFGVLQMVEMETENTTDDLSGFEAEYIDAGFEPQAVVLRGLAIAREQEKRAPDFVLAA
jgi:hypothetical protein